MVLTGNQFQACDCPGKRFSNLSRVSNPIISTFGLLPNIFDQHFSRRVGQTWDSTTASLSGH